MPRVVTEWKVRISCADTDASGRGQHRPFGLGAVEWERDEATIDRKVVRQSRPDEGKLDHFAPPDRIGELFDKWDREGKEIHPFNQSVRDRHANDSRSSYRLWCPRCRRDVRISEPVWDDIFETLRQAEVSSIDLAQLERIRLRHG